MAGRLVLVQVIGVRIPVREPAKAVTLRGCFCNKRTSKLFAWFTVDKNSGSYVSKTRSDFSSLILIPFADWRKNATF